MSSIRCIICHYVGQDFNILKNEHGEYYQCPNCGSICLNTASYSFQQVHSAPAIRNVSWFTKLLHLYYTRLSHYDVVQYYYYKWIVKHANIDDIASVLDIGCDHGRMLYHFQCLGKRVLGYEPDASKIDYSMVKEHQMPEYFDVDTKVDGSVDLIVVGQALYYWYNQLEILNKLDSILNAKGYIFIATANTEDKRLLGNIKAHSPAFISQKALIDYYTGKNYEIIACETLEPSIMPSTSPAQTNNPSFVMRTWNFLAYFFRYCRYMIEGYYKPDGYHLFMLVRKKQRPDG